MRCAVLVAQPQAGRGVHVQLTGTLRMLSENRVMSSPATWVLGAEVLEHRRRHTLSGRDGGPDVLGALQEQGVLDGGTPVAFLVAVVEIGAVARGPGSRRWPHRSPAPLLGCRPTRRTAVGSAGSTGPRRCCGPSGSGRSAQRRSSGTRRRPGDLGFDDLLEHDVGLVQPAWGRASLWLSSLTATAGRRLSISWASGRGTPVSGQVGAGAAVVVGASVVAAAVVVVASDVVVVLATVVEVGAADADDGELDDESPTSTPRAPRRRPGRRGPDAEGVNWSSEDHSSRNVAISLFQRRMRVEQSVDPGRAARPHAHLHRLFDPQMRRGPGSGVRDGESACSFSSAEINPGG